MLLQFVSATRPNLCANVHLQDPAGRIQTILVASAKLHTRQISMAKASYQGVPHETHFKLRVTEEEVCIGLEKRHRPLLRKGAFESSKLPKS